MHPRIDRADRLQRPQKRVRGTDLVVPVGADQQQVPHFRVRNQMLEEVKRCCIQPLQVIEEQCERMVPVREHTEEASENHLEAVLCILRREVRNGRLFPDDELQLGDEVHDKLAIRAYRVLQRVSPLVYLRFALGENLIDEGLEGLCQGRVGDVALILVKLAGCEEAARRYQRLVQLIYDG